jgi:hypothetical protein
MSPKWARLWFAATAACVVAGVTISAFTAANGQPKTAHFHAPAARFFNTFAFFTVQSNLLIGVAALLLAIRLERSSTAFAVLRLTGLVAILVTAIVFHAVLAGLLNLSGWGRLGNELVHTIVPAMAVVGWLMVGPRGLVSKRIVWLSLIFPVCWLAFTLIRGAIIGWYPYPFIDVTQIGYARAAVNCVWIALLLLGLAAGATVLDGRLGKPGLDDRQLDRLAR